MQHRMLKVSLAGAGALTLALGFAAPALADWAPQPGDVVGVGSDTLQYAGDFVADGSYNALPGYNSSLNKFAVVNFDATPDANARLGYGPGGAFGFKETGTDASGNPVYNSSSQCAPGNGSTNGSGNSTSSHTDTPCGLNPTIVEQAGTKPVQRPNGSGAGAKAFAGDTADGNDFLTYSRASSCQDTSCAAGNVLSASSYDVLKIGTDPLAMLTATTTNVPALSAAELGNIYKCTYKTFSDIPGYSGSAGSQFIVPIIPQVGSGTRSSFESAIGITDAQVGSCVETAEENDPTAIAAAIDPTDDAGTVDTTPSADALEPMSGARLNLFNGLSGATSQALRFGKNPLVSQSTGTTTGGYFQDPTCGLGAGGSFGSGGDCATASLGGVTQPNATISTSNVQLVTTGTPPDSGSVFNISRNLLIYFRASQLDSSGGWQPGTIPNAIRTLFYNPCDAFAQSTGSCVTVSGTQYGPGGQPYYATTAAQEDIAASGINPAYEVSTTGAQNL
jgi:hypothetical protein